MEYQGHVIGVNTVKYVNDEKQSDIQK